MNFSRIPANLRIPLFYAEFDNTAANQGGVLQPYKVLVLAPKIAAGTAVVNVPVLVSNVNDAIAKFGAGSVMADMVEKYLDNNSSTPLYCLPVLDNAAGVAATGTITLAGAPTEAGTIAFRIGGRSFKLPVSLTSTPTTLATALAALVNADARSLVTASAAIGVVTLTMKNKGVFGNELGLSDSHFEGEVIPAGVTVTYAAMSGGATNPDLASAIASIGDAQYILMTSPFTDAESLLAIETELNRRFGPLAANDGFHVVGKRAGYSALVTLGSGRNSQFTTIVSTEGPNSPWQWAAAEVAQLAFSAANDPARPFQTLVLTNILAPKSAQRFTLEERNILVENGISTYFVDAGGNVNMETMVTTYKVNSFGSPDESYKYLNTPLTLSYLRFDLKATITSKFPRVKLAKNGTQVAPGQAIVTPNDIKAEIIAKFRDWESRGLVENFDLFKTNLIVEINALNPNRVDILLPPDLVNQLIVVAAKIQFRN